MKYFVKKTVVFPGFILGNIGFSSTKLLQQKILQDHKTTPRTQPKLKRMGLGQDMKGMEITKPKPPPPPTSNILPGQINDPRPCHGTFHKTDIISGELLLPLLLCRFHNIIPFHNSPSIQLVLFHTRHHHYIENRQDKQAIIQY